MTTAVVDAEKLYKEIGYKPHSESQASIHKSTARFKVACCGRRFGKSIAAARDVLPDLFKPDQRWWICGPTYKLGEKEFRVVHDDLFKKLGVPRKQCKVSYNVQQGQMRIQLPWDTVVEVVSAEKQDSLVGEGLDGVIMSEAAKHKRSTWEQYIEPALADKRGRAIFPSTPEGYNWFYGLWKLGQTDQDIYASWRFPTWYNTVAFPGGYDDPEIQRIKSTVSEEYFSQEYGAEFTTSEGRIYPAFTEETHTKKIYYRPEWRNWLAFDFGFTNQFVCLDIMIDPSDRIYVWREYVATNKTTWECAHELRGRDNPPGYHFDGMAADPRGANEGATLAMVLGTPWQRPVSWIEGVEQVRRAIKLRADGEPGLFVDPSCRELIRQMLQLRKPNQSETKNVREGQHDFDDHCPDALRYFFSEYFVLGAAGSLADAGKGYKSEGESFFEYHGQFVLPDQPAVLR